MFIPIDARADVADSKKGKLTPAQHAQLNAWCLANKTGILDWGDKCQSTSSSYAVINSEATVYFQKGYIVICGRLVECEGGTDITLQSLTNGERGWIVAKYDLTATGAGEFSVVQKKSTEGALVQQDLNDNPITAKYEFALYEYEVTSNGSDLVLTRTGDYVPDIGGKLKQFEEELTAEGKPLNGYDTTKGTIEERLTDLGFKTGNATNLVNMNSVTLKKLGKFVICTCSCNATVNDASCRIPAEFRPYETKVLLYTNSLNEQDAVITADGLLLVNHYRKTVKMTFGWSTDPNYPI